MWLDCLNTLLIRKMILKVMILEIYLLKINCFNEISEV